MPGRNFGGTFKRSLKRNGRYFVRLSKPLPSLGVRATCIYRNISRKAIGPAVAVGDGYGAIEGAPPPTAHVAMGLKSMPRVRLAY